MIRFYLSTAKFRIASLPKAYQYMIGAVSFIFPVPFLVSYAHSDISIFMLGMMALGGLALAVMSLYHIIHDFVKWVKSGR